MTHSEKILKTQGAGLRREERSLSRRITYLLVVAAILLLGQSIYNLSNLEDVDRSIVTVNKAALSLDDLSRNIMTPIADIRILSMEMVSAPNETLVEKTNRRLVQRIEELESHLSNWQNRFDTEGVNSSGRKEFKAIQSAWVDYKQALSKTNYYIKKGIRVASFISVTGQEKVSYEKLQKSLTSFGQTQIGLSKEVYVTAQKKSSVAYTTLVITAVVQILVLIFILYFVSRIFRSYVQTSQAHEQELEVALDAAKQATDAKGEFLASMSHEIRTPMNGVVGMADLLSQSELTEDQRSMLNTIRDSGNSLLTVINDILDFSKIEAGKLNVESVPFSMSDVIEGAAATISPNASRKNVQIITYVDPNIPQSLRGDPVRLRQIVFNLTGNAVKFSEQGEVVVRADNVSKDDGPSRIKIAVIDQGIGISEDAQTKLFEAFSQADNSTTRRFGGTGLGLTICKSLTEIMGGKIAVESQLGSGSTFSVELPLEVGDEDKTPADDIDLVGVRVLVVTEIGMLGYAIKQYLEHWGVEVHVAPDETKVEAITSNPNTEEFNVIVIDFNLNDDLQQTVLSRYKSDNTKFIVLSDGQQRSARMSAPNVIALDGNPLRQAQLVDAVAICVGRASPLVKADMDNEVIKAVEPLSVDAALAQGTLILLAEDNITNQKVIQRQLNMLGYTCEIADDGKLALKAWRERDYGLLLTDCHMPHMDGFELTAAIREDEERTDMRAPIIAVTANALEGEAQRCIAGGMDDYLSKPLAMNDLKAMLRKWMPDATTVPSKTNVAEEPESIISAPGEEAPQASSGDGAIDPSALKSVFGDDEETFREILQEFVEPSADNVKEIEAAFENHSSADVALASHKLKSSSRSVGANELADICTELESAGKNDDWDTINGLVPRLPIVMQHVSDYIENL